MLHVCNFRRNASHGVGDRFVGVCARNRREHAGRRQGRKDGVKDGKHIHVSRGKVVGIMGWVYGYTGMNMSLSLDYYLDIRRLTSISDMRVDLLKPPRGGADEGWRLDGKGCVRGDSAACARSGCGSAIGDMGGAGDVKRKRKRNRKRNRNEKKEMKRNEK